MNIKFFRKLSLLLGVSTMLFVSIIVYPKEVKAKQFTDADMNIITDVTMSHANGTNTIDDNHWEYWETVQLTYKFDLGYPKKIASGDTFTFYLPDAFKGFSSQAQKSNVYVIDEDGNQVVLAEITLYPDNRVVMDFSKDNGYIDTHDDISGKMMFQLKFSETYTGDSIEFEGIGEVEVDYEISPPQPVEDPQGEQNSLLKSAQMVDEEERIMHWTLKVSFSEDVKNASIIDTAENGTHAITPYRANMDPKLDGSSNAMHPWETYPNWNNDNFNKTVVRVRKHIGLYDENGNPDLYPNGVQKIKEDYIFVEIEPLSYDEEGNIISFKVPIGDVKNYVGNNTDIMIDYYSKPLNLNIENYYNGAVFKGDGMHMSGTGVVSSGLISGEANGTARYVQFVKNDDKGSLIPTNTAKFKLEKINGNNDVLQTFYLTLTNGMMQTSLTKGKYRLIEVEAPMGYELLDSPIFFDVDDTTSMNKNIPTQITIENIKGATQELTINKVWKDKEVHDDPMDYIEVMIYQDTATNSIEYVKKKIFAKDGWTLTLSSLPEKNTKGEDVSYSVKELNPPLDYEVDIVKEANTITINNVLMTKDITVVKQWNDNDDSQKLRPNDIIIILYADGLQVDEKIVTAAMGWRYTFVDLPKNQDGVEIVYTIGEVAIKNYESEINGYMITNHLINKGGPITSKPSVEIPPKTGVDISCSSFFVMLLVSAVTVIMFIVKRNNTLYKD